jgi:hypothetical protein
MTQIFDTKRIMKDGIKPVHVIECPICGSVLASAINRKDLPGCAVCYKCDN